MSDAKQCPGCIGWIDLTVADAAKVRDFYSSVVGWTAEPVDMGQYNDFAMKPSADAAPVAGVCHARGSNTGLPPVWLLYILVADIDTSLAQVKELGGTIVAGPNGEGAHRYAIIKDPAGAICALYQAPSPG